MNEAIRVSGEGLTHHLIQALRAVAVFVLGNADIGRCEVGDTDLVVDTGVFGIERSEGVSSADRGAGLGLEEARIHKTVGAQEKCLSGAYKV